MRVELYFEKLRHQPRGYVSRLKDHLAAEATLQDSTVFWDQVRKRTVVEFDLTPSANPRTPPDTLSGIAAVAEALAGALEDTMGYSPSFTFQAEPLREQDSPGIDLTSVQLSITLDSV